MYCKGLGTTGRLVSLGRGRDRSGEEKLKGWAGARPWVRWATGSTLAFILGVLPCHKRTLRDGIND